MPHNFYSNQRLNFISVGSVYKLEGQIYLASGDGNFRAEITDAGINSYHHYYDFYGELGRWKSFETIFTGTAAMSGGLLRFTWTGSEAPVSAYFDNIMLSDLKDIISLGVLQIYPEWNMQRQTAHNRATHRTKSGKAYSYKLGTYKEFKFNLEYIQNSKAAMINSWWAADALIYFKVYSTGVWEVNCCHLINNISPFDESEKPYHQYRSGILELETY